MSAAQSIYKTEHDQSKHDLNGLERQRIEKHLIEIISELAYMAFFLEAGKIRAEARAHNDGRPVVENAIDASKLLDHK